MRITESDISGTLNNISETSGGWRITDTPCGMSFPNTPKHDSDGMLYVIRALYMMFNINRNLYKDGHCAVTLGMTSVIEIEIEFGDEVSKEGKNVLDAIPEYMELDSVTSNFCAFDAEMMCDAIAEYMRVNAPNPVFIGSDVQCVSAEISEFERI